MARGRFIVIEGIDGAGKTTQARALVSWLRAGGVPAIFTREPSDGPVGRLIREVLRGGLPMDARTLALLFAADRLDHVAREVEPRLGKGEWVVSDRYVLSSLVYQKLDAPAEWVRALNRFAPAPDLTVFLRLAPRAALARMDARPTRERFEQLATLRRVAANYERWLRRSPGRTAAVDGDRDVIDVLQSVRAAVRRRLRPALRRRITTD